MVEVKMNTRYSKDGQQMDCRFQTLDMESALCIAMKVQEIFYDEGYKTTNIKIEELDL